MPSCVFCDLQRIASPIEWTAWEGHRVMIFEPLNPVTPGHLLVVPAFHTDDAAASPTAAAAAMGAAARVARRYPAANIITSIGEDATQTVFHLHLHVVPRHPGDGLRLPWSPVADTPVAGGSHARGSAHVRGNRPPQDGDAAASLG